MLNASRHFSSLDGQTERNIFGSAVKSSLIGAFTFGSGVDIVSGFGATDTIDATTAGAATSALLAYDTDLVAGTSYIMYGTYANATGVFTAAAAFNASTAKDALYVEGDAGSLTFLTTTGYVVLDDLTAAIGASNIV